MAHLSTLMSVPLHNSLKNGMLHAIITEVSRMRSITAESIIELI